MKVFLEKLGFLSQNQNVYQKIYPLQGYVIKVDVAKSKIYYRTDEQTTILRVFDKQIQLGDKTTSNFKASESLVVLECVDRLLNKGYNPEDIHLERRYPSGRGASGGKSDVCVYGTDTKALMVIECKTYGEEFEKEKKKMDEHGGQLFAYLANDQNAKFLVLYTSKWNENAAKFEYENSIIQIKDREEDLQKSSKEIEEENIKLYHNAKNKGEYFEVWKESFNKYVHFNGIFDEDALAYSLELKALKRKNLKALDDAAGLFNKFAEILRHNNISDNANAFNKILSLFLCKIVDEEKDEEAILDFQVKEDEPHEYIIDRLQALYQRGMKKLNEDIVYFSDDVVKDIISLYPQQTALENLQDVFTQLKYYTNNEFAFKEVHNKKLFAQNGRVLNEVIKLLQNFQFRFTSKQQVLGDFFELMLNHGVKQSEGQFFTPIPIVRFIILSLGYENIIERKIIESQQEDKPLVLPKILDYACGAGHFLTESVEELQTIIKQFDASKLDTKHQTKFKSYSEGTEWAKDYIYGIEKDYRLARTSQIACYINGDGDANIIFGDGLEYHKELDLEKARFDVIVANPPYSVEAFKNYLNVGKTHFDLFEHLGERSSQIEALFMERTKQLLAYNGVAGIVLPSTILSNTGIYTKVRELILKHFEIKAVTELGSKTFIATGTTTVILFLKRRHDDFLKDREYIASDLFSHTKYAINVRYIDADIFLKMFCEHRDFDFDEYERFLAFEISKDLVATEMFRDYQDAFDNSAETKDLHKKTFFKNYTEKEKEKELTKRFFHFCKEKEKEKFLYFMLCLGDGNKNIKTIQEYYKPQQTIIVKTGKETDEQKEYLGYEFQGKKGSEGIKIKTVGGKLYDDADYHNLQKASSYVRKAIANTPVLEIDETQKNNVIAYNLFDLIDFDRIDFEKIVKTTADKKISWTSFWETDRLQFLKEIADIQKGTAITKEQTEKGDVPVVAGGQQSAYFHNKSNRAVNTITISASGAYAGFVNFWNVPIFASDCITLQSKNENEFSSKLLYELLKITQPCIYQLQKGAAQPHVYQKDIDKLRIPMIAKSVQDKILKGIAQIEQKETESVVRIEQLNSEIKLEFTKVTLGKKTVRLDTVFTLQNGKGLSKKDIVEGKYPVFGGNGIYGYHNEYNIEKETIAIGRVGEYCGAIHIVPPQSWISDNSMLINDFLIQINLNFLAYSLKELNLNQYAKRSSQPSISQPDIMTKSIPLPSIEEQQTLMAIIENKEQEIEKLKRILTHISYEKEQVIKKYL